MDVAAVVDLGAVQRAVGADLADVDPHRVGLVPGELEGSLTAAALARSVDPIAKALSRVAERVENLGRRTAWGATALEQIDAATADGLQRDGG